MKRLLHVGVLVLFLTGGWGTVLAAASSFAPPIFSRQHAPPRTSPSRHVLIGVFLI